MTSVQKGALLRFGAVLALLTGAAFALDAFARAPARRRARRPNPWITLRRRSRTGHRQRVFIDDDGRIEKGLPEKFRGVHIGDLTEVSRGIRQTTKEAAAIERRMFRKLPGTFPSRDDAFRSLMLANPHLEDFLEREWGQTSSEWRAWRRRGRRGPKPQAGAFDGRFDALNGYFDLHGKKAVGSWLEAVYVAIPTSRRWDDFADRLPVLEEASGLRIALPKPAELRSAAEADREQHRRGADEAIEALLERARRGRLARRDDEEVPF